MTNKTVGHASVLLADAWACVWRERFLGVLLQHHEDDEHEPGREKDSTDHRFSRFTLVDRLLGMVGSALLNGWDFEDLVDGKVSPAT